MSNRINIANEYREKFYRLPKVFFTSDCYKSMSNNAKLAWAILRDRVDLSQRNNWVDDNGDIYFIYTNKDLMSILNIGSTSTLNSVKKELINAKLLEQEKRGLNKANRLYLLNPEVQQSDIYEIKHQENNLINELEEKEFGNKDNDKSKSVETLDNSGHSKIERPFSESGHSNIERQDVRKSNTNDTDSNNTKDTKDTKDHSDLDLHNLFNISLRDKNQETDEILIREYIKQNSLEEKYGKNFLNVVTLNSKKDLILFKQMIDTIEYAIKSVEKEENESIEVALLTDMPFSEALREDLTRTIYDVLLRLRTDKYQKIKDPKAYLFISIKKVIKHWVHQVS